MYRWLHILLIELIILFFIGNVTFSQNDADKYINPDVTAAYSTHPERPFRYGFAHERTDILKLFEDQFNAYEISSGDVGWGGLKNALAAYARSPQFCSD